MSSIRQIIITPSLLPDKMCFYVAARHVMLAVCSPAKSPQDFFVLKSYIFTTSSVPPSATKFPLVVAHVKADSDATNANSYFSSIFGETKPMGFGAEKPTNAPS
jgi:hypothetical protein